MTATGRLANQQGQQKSGYASNTLPLTIEVCKSKRWWLNKLLLPLQSPLSLIRLALIDFFLLSSSRGICLLRRPISVSLPARDHSISLSNERWCQWAARLPVPTECQSFHYVHSQNITCSSSSSDRPRQQLIIFSFGPSTLTQCTLFYSLYCWLLCCPLWGALVCSTLHTNGS